MKKARALITQLGLMPPNVLTPGVLAEYFHTSEQAIDHSDLVGLRAVGRHKAYLGRSTTGLGNKCLTVAIIGKGVTFDSGGISIKSANKMGDMKFDMLGAATVLALEDTLSTFNGKVHIYAPIAENTFGEDTMRPGDVLTYANDTKVEVVNTDAEGRLILADAIIRAKSYKIDVIITVATLTGAAAGALGEATALFGNNEALITKALDAAKQEKELLWQLPIWDIHRKNIKAKKGVADIMNQGSMAGASTAAAFLEHFVGKTPWLHFDIAGSAYKNGKPTGAMLSTLTTLIHSL